MHENPRCNDMSALVKREPLRLSKERKGKMKTKMDTQKSKVQWHECFGTKGKIQSATTWVLWYQRKNPKYDDMSALVQKKNPRCDDMSALMNK